MEQETTHEMLTKIVQQIAQEPAGYFCHDGVYCEEVDCDGVDENGDYCDKHDGSVLDVEYHISGNGDFLGCTVCVGTGGPHLELNTRENVIIGHWSNNTVRKHYVDASEVNEFWQEMYENIRS